jgi:hypothetical protein
MFAFVQWLIVLAPFAKHGWTAEGWHELWSHNSIIIATIIGASMFARPHKTNRHQSAGWND